MQNNIKSFYSEYGDEIIDKRLKSPYPLRKYSHLQQYETILKHVTPNMRVLDAGCGEGVLSVMMAKKGAFVTACDISKPNIERCKEYAKENSIDNIDFIVSDLENLPFKENEFDLVVSSHVLEHLPDFDRGLSEIMRVSKKRAVVAIPTALNLCSIVQLGRGWFYLKGVRSFCALPIGLLKVFFAYFTGREGVDETYASDGMPHVFRFPYIMKNKTRDLGLILKSYEASTVCLPYFVSFLPIIKFLDKYKDRPIIRNFGYGTTYIIEK